MKRKILYRVEIDYLYHNCDDSSLKTSNTAYSLDDAETQYSAALAYNCADDKSKPAHVQILKYTRAGLELLKENYKKAQWLLWNPGKAVLVMTGEQELYECSACTAKFANKSETCKFCGAYMVNL